MIVDLALEGIGAALMPCSFVLLVPGLASLLAARQEAPSALVGFVVGSLGLAFVRFSERASELPTGVVAVAFAAAATTLALPLVRRLNVVSGTGGLLVGLASGSLWVPCVGLTFAELVNTLPDRNPVVGLLLLAVYLAGVLTPVVALGIALWAIPNPALIFARPLMLVIGCGVLGLLALAVAAGLSDDVIGRLVEASTT